MTIIDALWRGLVQSSFVCGLVLGAGLLMLWLVRPPADQLRVIQFVLAGCLIAPWISGLSAWNSVSLKLVERRPAESMAATDRNAARATHSRRTSFDAVPAGEVRTAVGGPEPSPTPEQNPVDAARAAIRPVPAGTAWQGLTFNLRAVSNSIAGVMVALYAAVSLTMIAWWLVGLKRRNRLERTARVASADLQSLFAEMSTGSRRPIRLLVSDQIASPMTWGLLRPIIILPAPFEKYSSSAQWRWSLAHELSHVERRDVATLALASVVQLICFHQPFYWWLRRRMSLCQDYLADARAAHEAESTEDYAAFLVRLARLRLHTELPIALGMAPVRSSLFRRITFLLSSDGRVSPDCSRATAIGSTIAACGFLALLTTVHLDAEDAAAAQARDHQTSNLMTSATNEEPTVAAEADLSSRPHDRQANVAEGTEPDHSDRFTLTGQILDYAGHPASNAQLRLIVSSDLPTGMNDSRFNWTLIETGQLGQKPDCDQFLSAETSDEGRFEFHQILPGKSLQLAYWGDGVPAGKSLAFDQTTAGGNDDVLIQLPEPATLRGTIDRAEFPAAASLQLNAVSPSGQSRTILLKNNQTGFEFDDLPPGEYVLFLLAQAAPDVGHRGVFVSQTLGRVPIRLRAGQTEERHFGPSDVSR